MEINCGKSYNKYEEEYNITIYISIPKHETIKIKNEELYREYIGKKFDAQSKTLFANALCSILK